MNYPTWSDLNNPSIVPPMGARTAPDIGSVAVMVSCEPDVRLIRSHNAMATSHPFFNSTLMALKKPHEGISVAGPFIGAPYATMLLESLIAKGASNIIVLGWCGATGDELNVGDLVIPRKAIVDEGTSNNYKVLDKTVPVSMPHEAFSAKLSGALESSGFSVKNETIWTTDAIYRETREKVTHFHEMGAMAVEMECSALFSVAEYRSVKICSLLVVSDSVASKEWNPGFRKKQFKQARKDACATVMNFARQINALR